MICSVVTGGAGFIGSHLVERLIEVGHRVIVIDNLSTGRQENLAHIKNEYLHFVERDICDIKNFQPPCEIDYVFHLAGRADIVPSITRPEDYFQSNVTGTFEILQWARSKSAKRFIYAASSSCYGIPYQYPTPEESEISPQYPYALTKAMGEEMVMHWGKVYKMPVMSLRLFNVYGLRARTNGAYGAVMGIFLAQIANGKPVTIVGDGSQKRDFTHVRDVAQAFLGAAESSLTNEIFNVGTGTPYSVIQLAKMLGATEFEFLPKRPGEPEVTWADTTKIKTMLKWTPEISFSEGIWHMRQNVAQYKNAPLWTRESIEDATHEWFRRLA